MNLISKKELLEMTGISYGQLYRWKREGLLPEEWFIKQSSFTGQETFFPRDQVVSRVRAILGMKDNYSLEELADILMTRSDAIIDLETLKRIPGINADCVAMLEETLPKAEFSLCEVAVAQALNQKKQEADMSKKAMQELFALIVPALTNLKAPSAICTILKTGDAYHACFTTGTDLPLFDAGASVIATASIGETMNELRALLEGAKNAQAMEGK